MKKALLILLVIVCLAVAAWNAYLLFTKQTEPSTGWVILAVSVGVLFWNISVLRAYRIGSGTVVAIFLIVALLGMTVSAFAGIEPFAGIKTRIVDGVVGSISRYDVELLPGQSKVVEDWKISLDGGGWKGSTLTVKLTITNLGPRRNFGGGTWGDGIYFAGPDSGPDLVAIDSTNKLVAPWMPESIWEIHYPPYTQEFYPNESWTGSLKFEMSSYSGKTGLYMTTVRYQHEYHHFLFDVGEPKR